MGNPLYEDPIHICVDGTDIIAIFVHPMMQGEMGREAINVTKNKKICNWSIIDGELKIYYA